MKPRLKQSPLPARTAPASPQRHWIWQDEGAYDGLFLPSPDGTEALQRRYLPLAREILALDAGVCLLFADQVTLSPDTLGSGVPLRRFGPDSYASFRLEEAAQERSAATLHLMQNGNHVEMSLKHSRRFDPLDFWNFSILRIVRSHALISLNPWQGEATATPVRKASGALAESIDLKPVFEEMRADLDPAPQDSKRKRRRVREGRGWLNGLFGRRTFGPMGAGTGTRKAPLPGFPPPPKKTKQPGLLSRLAGWALWNTSAGKGLQSAMEKHMRDVSEMIDRGDVDEALKRAFALGRENEGKKRDRGPLPTSLPKPRASLDLDFSGVEGPSSSILTDRGYHQLVAKYQTLAKSLAEKGDHRRAAFIYSELLNNPTAAVDQLEAMEAFEEAARLVLARKLPPQRAVHLWFRAGRKDIALALAKRFDLLEFLSNTAVKSDPNFADFVRGHWIDALLQAGETIRAIVESEKIPAYAERRIQWIEQAIVEQGLDDPTLLHAALSSLEWSFDALTRMQLPNHDDAAGLLTSHLQGILQGQDTRSVEQRATLLNFLRDRDVMDRGVAPVWRARAPALADRLIRNALGFGDPIGNMKSVHSLARKFQLRALAEDLRQIKRRASKDSRDSSMLSVALPPPPDNATQWRYVACAAKGETLIGSAEGEIVKLDREGRRLWTDYLTDLAGIVPIGSGRLALVLQGHSTKRTISVLDTAQHLYRPLGVVDLLGWHGTASPTQFLVQTPDAVAALDMTRLLAETPQVESVWSVKQTVAVKVLCFLEEKKNILWISQRLDGEGRGLLETWEFSNSGTELRTHFIALDQTRKLYAAQHIIYERLSVDPLQGTSITPKTTSRAESLNRLAYSYDEERRLIASGGAAQFATQRDVILHAHDQGRIICTTEPDATRERAIIGVSSAQGRLHLAGAEIMAQSSLPNTGRIALIDSKSRLIIGDLDADNLIGLSV